MEEKENEEELEVLFYLAKHESDDRYQRPTLLPFANKLDNIKIDIQNLVKGPDIRVIDEPDGI